MFSFVASRQFDFPGAKRKAGFRLHFAPSKVPAAKFHCKTVPSCLAGEGVYDGLGVGACENSFPIVHFA
jgi:hypothetical protein